MVAGSTVFEMSADNVGTKLFRYGLVDGVRTLKDSQLGQVFNRAKEEGLLSWVMYSENVDEMTVKGFADYYKDDSRMLFLIFFRGKLAGWIWLDDFGHRTARIHFGFFRWLAKERLTVRVARETLLEVLNMRFRGGTSLRVIRGETPAFNAPAVHFLRKIGMKIVGETPLAAYRYATDSSSSMIHSYITKDMLKDAMASRTADADAADASGVKEPNSLVHEGRREAVSLG